MNVTKLCVLITTARFDVRPRLLSLSTPYFARILGIETSCDDTGVAIVDSNGSVHAESLYSQSEFHDQLGGVMPPIAKELHAQNVVRATEDCLSQSGLRLRDLDAVAVTVKPGLKMTLEVGLNHAKSLVHSSGLPLIPIHHMEAHALTPRLSYQELGFPFLVLLVSGGHCLLALVKEVNSFFLMGTTGDDAPGEMLDKIARRLKLRNLESCRNLSGGPAIERLAKEGDPSIFEFPLAMLKYRDCHFSFSGMKRHAYSLIEEEEALHNIQGGDVLPNVASICAGLQLGLTKHLALRVARAFLYCDRQGFFEDRPRHLVMSGGVGANAFLRHTLNKVCVQFDAKLICPTPRLCTDNGVMIAWNGVEKWNVADGIIRDFEDVKKLAPVARSPLGQDISGEVGNARIRIPMKEINSLIDQVMTENKNVAEIDCG
jgi:N6-L-threonylcarbamoyladenine synthase